jgi:hypothetical protein
VNQITSNHDKGVNMKRLIISALALVGIANAAHVPSGESKLLAISNIDESTPLILQHAKDFEQTNKKVEVAYHYSHRSHYSHYSHRSHYSHYSSY